MVKNFSQIPEKELLEKVLKLNELDSFNPMQEKVLSQNLLDSNIVVSAPTASGKTLVSEIAALNSIINKRKKVVYTCPLRALANEHYEGFKRKYSDSLNVKATISTGDFDSSSKHLKNYDIIFTTHEKADSLQRHNAEWLQDVGLLILDEIHDLDSGRGPTLEIVTTKFRFINPKIQILALSATIPNCKDIADWLQAELVESDYRPVKLKEGVLFQNEINYNTGSEEIIQNDDSISSIITDTLKIKKKQALVFANTRRNAEASARKLSAISALLLSEKEKSELEKASEKILDVLESPTEQCKKIADFLKKGSCFHHAGILSKQKTIIEDEFKKNNLKVISATPTLASGINLPAHTVVISSIYRYGNSGMEKIPVRDYKQMCLPFKTKILTKKFGFIEIGEVVNNKLNCEVLSFNLDSLKYEFKSIENFFSRRANELTKLIFNIGNELKLTSNHKLLVYEDNTFTWKKAENLVIGDSVVHQKNQINFNQKTPLFFELMPVDDTFVIGQGSLILKAKNKFKITEKELAHKLDINHKRIYHIKKNKKAMKLSLFFKLSNLLKLSDNQKAKLTKNVKSAYGTILNISQKPTDDFLWLVGLIATDGNVNHQIDKRSGSGYAKIRIFNKNPKLINKAKKVFGSIGLNPAETVDSNGHITLEVGATILAKILENHFGIPYGNKTSSVSIPEFLLNSDKKLVGAYLGGVFDGDGSYTKRKQKKSLNSQTHRIVFATSSKNFVFGIQSLLLRLGIVSKVTRDHKIVTNVIRGKLVTFNKPVYYIVFRKIEYLKKFAKYAKIHKTKIKVDYSTYHNLNKLDNSNKDFELVKITKIAKIKNPQGKVFNIQVKDNENYFADNILTHNCGRAGRPKYDIEGRAIMIAKNELEADDLFERYVNGRVEEVSSQLGIESVLRMHLLSLISNNFVFDLDSMEKFFSKTFYANQFGNLNEIYNKLQSILFELQEMEFVTTDEKYFQATKLGKRVSELYLDPKSAHKMIIALKKQIKFTPETYIFSISDTSEFFPWLNVPKNAETELWEFMQEDSSKISIDVKNEMHSDSNLLRKYYLSLLLNDWISEKREQDLMKQYNIQPGILYAKLQIAEWLCYAMFEISKLIGTENHIPNLGKMQKRLKYGVKEELLVLTELKGIGRIRARALKRAGFESIAKIKNAPLERLSDVIGSKTAQKLKLQLRV